jgi:Cu2+-containing amine oxidase
MGVFYWKFGMILYFQISLREPLDKEAVMGGRVVERKADVVLLYTPKNQCYEAVVSLTQQLVESITHIPSVFLSFSF